MREVDPALFTEGGGRGSAGAAAILSDMNQCRNGLQLLLLLHKLKNELKVYDQDIMALKNRTLAWCEQTRLCSSRPSTPTNVIGGPAEGRVVSTGEAPSVPENNAGGTRRAAPGPAATTIHQNPPASSSNNNGSSSSNDDGPMAIMSAERKILDADVQKFHYRLKVLLDRMKVAQERLAATFPNYQGVWKELCRRRFEVESKNF